MKIVGAGDDPALDAVRALSNSIASREGPERAIQVLLGQAVNMAIVAGARNFPDTLRQLADDYPAIVEKRRLANAPGAPREEP
jgi:hypothetical protein